MTAKEMEIRVLNDLSGLATQRTRKFFPEQIELELNTVIDSFVTSAVTENTKGFYTVNDKVLDAIQPIIETISLPVYHSGANKQSLVPLNLYKLLDVTAYGGIATGKTTTPAFKYVYTIEFPETEESTPYYKIVKFTVGTNELYIRTGNIGYSTKNTFHIINELTDNVDNLSWESAYHLRKLGKLIYISDTQGIPKVTIGTTDYVGVLVNTLTYTIETVAVNNTTSTRRIKDQMRSEVLSTAYYQPSILDIPILLNKSAITIYTPDNFIVNSVLISYIRRPRKISLSLNVGCDLDPNYHGQICDNTVQRIRERIGDPKVQTGNLI